MIEELSAITGKRMTLMQLASTMKKIRDLVRKSEFKCFQMAPTLRLQKIAFGKGRQVPMTSAWVA